MVSEKALQSIMLRPDASIRAAAKLIQDAEIKILLVCNEEGVLLGTVTDGDIRRAVSQAKDLDGRVDLIMNRTPKVARPADNVEMLKTRMRASVIRHMPRVNEDGCVVGIVLLDASDDVRLRDSPVVLMAGGRGSRLMPLTENTPKPLLKVGAKPVLERQIEQLIGYGFHRFYISVNYLGHMIEEYFGNGERLGVEISYIREDRPLGTAGALALLQPQQHPLIVMNGDIITKADFGAMLDYFEAGSVAATMGVREFLYTVPYGCVNVNGSQILTLEEKPTFRHLISAGIYVLSPDCLNRIPRERFFDMPQLFSHLIESGRPTNTFLISEEWIDIGHKDDLLWAQKLFTVEDQA